MARTTISLQPATRDRLKSLGRKGETYDELINRLIDQFLGIERRRRPAQGEQGVDFEQVR
ncbi:MAG: hypothetical protein R3185_04835 [Candidatus Thermoplasmatota archaeon]|nr:hypothetical protein [Candidatus Thermoplasmatota archaeon]